MNVVGYYGPHIKPVIKRKAVLSDEAVWRGRQAVESDQRKAAELAAKQETDRFARGQFREGLTHANTLLARAAQVPKGRARSLILDAERMILERLEVARRLKRVGNSNRIFKIDGTNYYAVPPSLNDAEALARVDGLLNRAIADTQASTFTVSYGTGTTKRVLGWEPKTKFANLVKLMVDADMELLRRHRRGEIKVTA